MPGLCTSQAAEAEGRACGRPSSRALTRQGCRATIAIKNSKQYGGQTMPKVKGERVVHFRSMVALLAVGVGVIALLLAAFIVIEGQRGSAAVANRPIGGCEKSALD